jgi:uncharacterized protein (TIGR00730 family)
MKINNITVFCGSSSGNDAIFEEQATLLGSTLAKQNIGLVYGGADIGLMGAVANGVLDEGGKVIGVIPRFLKTKEIAHAGLTELIVVESMHERKMKMNELCEGVISLPGGLGTLEEFFEMMTWAQLGLHQKPIGLLNVDGYYNPLITMLQTMADKGFMKASDHDLLQVSDKVEELLDKMRNYVAPAKIKWVNDETL